MIARPRSQPPMGKVALPPRWWWLVTTLLVATPGAAVVCTLVAVLAYQAPGWLGLFLLGSDPSQLLQHGGRVSRLRFRVGVRLVHGLLPTPTWLIYPLGVATSCRRRLWCAIRLHDLYYAAPADRVGPWHVRVRAVCCHECHDHLRVADASV